MAAAVVALVVGVGAGCGKPSGPGIASATSGRPSKSATATPSGDRDEQMRQFVRCMREHGVDMPDPGSTPGAMPSVSKAEADKIKKAQEACKQYAGGGVLNTPDPRQQEQMRQYAKCMREHGVDMPDPEPNAGGGALRISPDDPTFKAAQEACKDKLPQSVQTSPGAPGAGQ